MYLLALYTQNTDIELDTKIQVVSLHINLPSVNSSETKPYEVKPYSKDLQCVSYILSNKNKGKSLIYFVTHVSKGEFVVPLIHDDSYVERVYLYYDSDDQHKTDWMSKYSKISGSWSSLDKIEEQLTKDIKSMIKRPIKWTRSQELFQELWEQKSSLSDQKAIATANKNTFDSCQIIVLFSDGHQRFNLSYGFKECSTFDEIQHCTNNIDELEISSVFIIICGVTENNLNSIQSLLDKHSIHAAYIFRSQKEPHFSELSTLYQNFKLSGIFSSHSDLLVQLAADVYFYRQIPNNTPKITFFRTNVEVLTHLKEDEKEFLRYQLFFEVLSQYSPSISTDTESDLAKYTTMTEFSFINMEMHHEINHIYKQNDLRTMLESKMQEVVHINEKIRSLSLITLSSSRTVYRAQLLIDADLKSISENSTILFSMLSYIVVSESYPSVIEICRRMIRNGLTVVLLEIKLLQGASAYQLSPNSDILMLPVGAILRSKSIKQTPDKILHIESIYGENAMKHFKDQLHFETKKNLTTDTIKDYLDTLDKFKTISDPCK